MSRQEHKRGFPHWTAKPPDGYPFSIEPLNFAGRAYLPNGPHPHEFTAIEECGINLLQSGDYQDALWKFENCLLMQFEPDQQPQKIVECSCNCALALLKLYESEKDQAKKKKAIELCQEFCEICFRQRVRRSILEKVWHIIKAHIHLSILLCNLSCSHIIRWVKH